MNIQLTGKIDKEGKLKLSGINDFNEFMGLHKGDSIIMNLTVLPDKSTDRMIAYYYAVIPQIQEAYREQGERILREQITNRLLFAYPHVKDQEKIEEFTYPELYDFLEFVHEYVAVNLSVYIHRPVDIINKD